MISILQESERNYYASQILHGSFKSPRRYAKKASNHNSYKLVNNKKKRKSFVKNLVENESLDSFHSNSQLKSSKASAKNENNKIYDQIGTFIQEEYKIKENYKFLNMISVPRLDPAVPKPEGGTSVPACGEPLLVPASFPQSIEAAIHKFANASSKAQSISILDHYGKPASSITYGKKTTEEENFLFKLFHILIRNFNCLSETIEPSTTHSLSSIEQITRKQYRRRGLVEERRSSCSRFSKQRSHRICYIVLCMFNVWPSGHTDRRAASKTRRRLTKFRLSTRTSWR